MIPLILCNKLHGLRKFLESNSEPLRFLCLLESREGYLIRDYLRSRPGLQELPVADLFRERNESFRHNFVEFMGKVNRRNQSLDWWAMPFTNKNPLATSLCRNMSYFLLIAELLQEQSSPLLVITDSLDVVAQSKALAKREGYQVLNLVRAPRFWRTFVKLHTPAGVLKAAVRTLALLILGRSLRPASDLQNDHMAVVSVSHSRSFLESGGYHDVYFGSMLPEANESGMNPLMVGLAADRPMSQLKKFRQVDTGFPIIPLESCLTLANFVFCLFKSLGLYFRPVRVLGDMEIQGTDVSCLITRAMRDSRHSGDLFLNLRVYYCAWWLARNLKLSRCVYPFENRSWEKMLLLGVGDGDTGTPRANFVGYQHAALTMSHTNFMLADGEAEFTPLPSTILTTGSVITSWLEMQGNFPDGILQSACALRQAQPVPTYRRDGGSGPTNVLVALATKLDEYVKTLSLLESAFSGISGFNVRIRPHPEIPLELALDVFPPATRNFFSKSEGTLSEDLEWADVVLYASSTVGLEAVACGKPVVYLDLGDFLDTDPMSSWDGFKWTAAQPTELISALASIKSLTPSEFQQRQQLGYDYVGSYLTPVGADNIRLFWEA